MVRGGAVLWILLATAVQAQDAKQNTPSEVAQDNPHPTKIRDLCSDRPGLDTPACTVDPGHLQVEMGLAGWELDKQKDSRTDTITLGDVALRYGIGGTTELRLGWTAYGHVRERDFASGTIDRTSGIGDVTIGLKQNLRHPAEGKMGLAVAVLPFATLPSGHHDIGAGDWGGGLILPTSYKLSEDIQFEFSPEIDAAVNESGGGRHLAYGTAMGVQVHLGKKVLVTPEMQFLRDRDPEQHVTESRAAVSLAYLPQKMTQLDLQAVAGLNHNTPDVALSFGATRKF